MASFFIIPNAKHWFRTLLLLTLLGSTTACASGPSLYTAGSQQITAEPVTDFDSYRDRVRAVLETNRVALDGFPREQQIDWNLPFRRPAAKDCPPGPSTGILLVHGLSDSPFVFRDLADYLSDQCIEVRTLLLQGHGTRPGDMVDASASVWRQQVRNHFQALADSVDRPFIGGFSLGGALATEYALSGQSPKPAGLVALAPAWELNGLGSYLWLARVADLFGDFVEEEPELNPVKYESLAFNAGAQTADVLSETQDILESRQHWDLPLFLVATEADSVINLDYLVQQFRNRFTHPDSRMLVFRDLRQPWPDTLQSPRIESLNSFLPQFNILEFSHQSLAISANNELYGPGAPLQRCLEPNQMSVEDCRTLPPEQLWFSAWHGEPKAVPTSRLTWNPWFPEMADKIAQFLKTPTSPDQP